MRFGESRITSRSSACRKSHRLCDLDGLCALLVELGSVLLVSLLPAVIEAGACVVLGQSVLGAELALAETAIAEHSLDGLLAVVVLAADLLGSHDGDGIRWVGDNGGDASAVMVLF